MIKKIACGLIALMIVIQPIFISNVKAKTLGDLKKELEQKQQELSNNQNQIAQTEQEISAVNASVQAVEKQIAQTYIDIDNLTTEIESLNQQIAQKEQEVKEIVNFVQLSSGESAYLEYMFGATDFTDFIYRMAVSEQLTTYNEKLIDEFNTMIEENKKKQQEIEVKRGNLAKQQEQLSNYKRQLGQQLSSLSDTELDIEDEIASQKEIIELYESKGCKDNENISTCGKSLLPSGTAFYRPLEGGYVTSEWGYRNYMGKSWHEGIDMGAREGTTVYSLGNGMVAAIMPRTSCGGNMVIVHHNIKGTTYTSVYAHLLTINVANSQTVSKNTVIGTSGGQSTKSYDKCTGGAHLHLTVAKGLYGVDYTSWSYMNVKQSINPRTVINFPGGTYNSWSDRLTAY